MGGIEFAKQAIDIGIVVRDGDAALRFYRDTLGFDYVGAGQSAIVEGAVMHRMMCGDTLVKVLVPPVPPAAANPPGGSPAATGIRYWTIGVKNLDAVVGACRTAGYRIPVEPMDIRGGARIAMVEDPEGNWVELLQAP